MTVYHNALRPLAPLLLPFVLYGCTNNPSSDFVCEEAYKRPLGTQPVDEGWEVTLRTLGEQGVDRDRVEVLEACDRDFVQWYVSRSFEEPDRLTLEDHQRFHRLTGADEDQS